MQQTTTLSATPVLDRLAGMSMSELQAEAAAAQVELTRLEGLRGALLGELQARAAGVVPDPERGGQSVPVQRWWRDTSGQTGGEALGQVQLGVGAREMPLVTEAWAAGSVDGSRVKALTRLVGRVEDDALHAVQAQMLLVARTFRADALQKYVAHWIATHCEPAFTDEADSAAERRRLSLTDLHDGTFRLSGRLTADVAEALQTLLEPLARKDGDTDERPAEQRRADALGTVVDSGLRHRDLPDHGGVRPQVVVTVPAGWLLHDGSPTPAAALAGWRHQPDRHPADQTLHGVPPGAGGCPTAPWTGPVTREQVSALLCDARLSVAVLDHIGQVMGISDPQELVTARLRRAVVARDRGCAARGCTRPAAVCDVHHLHHQAHGGEHSIDNLVLLCRHHHLRWHHDLLTLHDLRVPWRRGPGDSPPAEPDTLGPPAAIRPGSGDAQPPGPLPA